MRGWFYLEHLARHGYKVAGINESVSLARSGVSRRHSGWAPGLVNAVLRNVVREGRLLPVQADDDLERLAIEHSHPRWIVARWVDRPFVALGGH